MKKIISFRVGFPDSNFSAAACKTAEVSDCVPVASDVLRKNFYRFNLRCKLGVVNESYGCGGDGKSPPS